jgi:chromosomal replication initiator protein
MNTLSEIWEIALDYLKGELSPIVFNQYMKPIEPVYHNNGTFVLKFPEEYQRLCVKNQYQILVSKALSYATGNPGINLKLVLDASEYEEAAFASADGYAPVQNYWRMSFNPKYTFDTFIEGSNNRWRSPRAGRRQNAAKKIQPAVHLRRFRAWQDAPDAGHRAEHLKRQPALQGRFHFSEKFTNDFIETIRNKTNFEFRKKYRSADVLLVDDISLSRARNRRRKNFSTRSTTLITRGSRSSSPPTNRPRTSQTRKPPALALRMRPGMRHFPPNYEHAWRSSKRRLNTSRFRSATRSMNSSRKTQAATCANWKAFYLKSSFYGNGKRPVSDGQLMEYLKKSLSAAEKRISPETVIQAAAKYYSVTYPDMLSSKRTMNIAKARQWPCI